MEELIKELLAKELPNLLKENLTVQIDVSHEPYEPDYKRITVTVEYEGEEISKYYDTINVPECNCGNC